jgi:hypothetical protein
VELEGGRIYFEVDGEGHPLLLIHGGLGSLRMWDRQVPAFSERYRVIRYDTRGFGRTKTDDVAFVNLDDAIAVLDHVEARSAYVVGPDRVDAPRQCRGRHRRLRSPTTSGPDRGVRRDGSPMGCRGVERLG